MQAVPVTGAFHHVIAVSAHTHYICDYSCKRARILPTLYTRPNHSLCESSKFVMLLTIDVSAIVLD